MSTVRDFSLQLDIVHLAGTVLTRTWGARGGDRRFFVDYSLATDTS